MAEEVILNKRYRLLTEIGAGKMAAVFRGEDTWRGVPVAVKVLRQTYAENEAFLTRLHSQAQALAGLAHPNIVAAYEMGQEGDRRYLVMELVEEPTLKELIRGGAPLSIKQALDIAIQICAAVGRPEAAMELIAGLGGVDSAAPSYVMWEMSRTVRASSVLSSLFDDGPNGLAARLRTSPDPEAGSFVTMLDDFLYEFGSRGPNEWDIHAPSWEVDPDLALAAVDRMRLATDDGIEADFTMGNVRPPAEVAAAGGRVAPKIRGACGFD